MGIIASAHIGRWSYSVKEKTRRRRGLHGNIGGIILFIFMIGRPAITSTMLSTLHADTFKFSNVLMKNRLTKSTILLYQTDKEYFGKAVAQEKYFQDGSQAEYIDKMVIQSISADY